MPQPATLLGGKLTFEQPDSGYRAAIDPILLAAACPTQPGHIIADLGCGAGAASLALAYRCAETRVISIDRQQAMLDFCQRNVSANQMEGRVTPIEADIRHFRPADAVDGVIINPPYLNEDGYTHSADASKQAANSEGDTPLSEWIAAARRITKPKGSLTIIHRADRLADILDQLQPAYGAIAICPLWPQAGQAAKRVIVSALMGRRSPLSLLPGLLLHNADGSFTAEAEAILRDGKPLNVRP